MELVPAETSLVVAGAWNASILTPGFVLHHGLNRPPDEQGRVQVFLPALQGAVFEFPKFVLDRMAYIVRPDALVIAPSESTADCFAACEEAVAGIVRVLPHTPITGIGHNFEFRDATPTPERVALFTEARRDLVDHMSEGWTPSGAAVAVTFKNVAETVHMNVQRQWDGVAVTIKFNFHHPVSSSDQALAVLSGAKGYQRMAQDFELAEHLIAGLYG